MTDVESAVQALQEADNSGVDGPNLATVQGWVA
jgi:hypothetical protein